MDKVEHVLCSGRGLRAWIWRRSAKMTSLQDEESRHVEEGFENKPCGKLWSILTRLADWRLEKKRKADDVKAHEED